MVGCPSATHPTSSANRRYTHAMPDGTPSLALSLHSSIHDIPAREWDVCAGPGNPFVSHAFLSAIEDSGSAGKRTGWLPRHAALRDQAGRLLATAPMYTKSHSYGEYVFDHGWARAFDQAGGDYYPKLQIAAPFSPVPGPRLLIRPDVDLPIAVLAGGLADTCAELGLSSVHATFCTESEYTALGKAGWLQRLGIQYHWYNQGFSSFDDFLAALNARKRKSIKRERRDAQSAGLEFHTLHGPEITAAQWKAFLQILRIHCRSKMGQRLPDRKILSLAGGKAWRARGADAGITGRQAGRRRAEPGRQRSAIWPATGACLGDFPFLHFELCYYRAIDYAIAHGLPRVEAGAQGEHKIQRGYLPVTDLLGALDQSSRPAPGHSGFSGPGASGAAAGNGSAGGLFALQTGRLRARQQAAPSSLITGPSGLARNASGRGGQRPNAAAPNGSPRARPSSGAASIHTGHSPRHSSRVPARSWGRAPAGAGRPLPRVAAGPWSGRSRRRRTARQQTPMRR